MINKLFVLTSFAFLALTNLYGQDELKTSFESVSGALKQAGTINYQENCPTCLKESNHKKVLGNLVSVSNHQTIELSVISEEELTQYFNELASNDKIPFGYAYDGCYARAHKMSHILAAKGIITGKAFVEGNLNVVSPLLGKVNWWYHVAPVVLVKKNGKEIPYVIDPSLFKKPVPFDEWRDSMTGGKAENLDNQYFTNRFSYSPNDKLPPPKTSFNEYDLADTQTVMSTYRSTLSQIVNSRLVKE
ncbi:MAG: protein-glutamine glutaminase family protein [Bacteriovorax sp.]|nr:protein-glutamine glutaminase family protein [Bacteriovorax sp.]